MLDVLNRYAHGFVVVPVTIASRRGGIFTALQARALNADELCAQLAANSGHLQVVLRLLESLGWIDRDREGRYRAAPALEQQKLIVDELWELVDVDFDRYLRAGAGGLLTPWIEKVRSRWNASDTLIADFLDGMLVVPVLALLTKRGLLRDLLQSDFKALPGCVRDEVVALLRTMGWLEGDRGNFTLTPPGAFMFERSMNLGVAESYRPMLRAMDRLLFGDAAGVFAHGADGHESHVDRSMNVISSGFQHDRYFAEVEEILISIFTREPFSEQPRYVADMGSGDGTFLHRVIHTVREKTPRGKVLAQYPLTLIGIDLNRASLEETSRTLAAEDHVVITGDIGKPARIIKDLQDAGVDPERVLHIRSFLDHDRPFIAPQDDIALAARSSARYLGAYSDRSGTAIPPGIAVQSLVEHLARWAGAINRHGLILLEVHCQDPLVVRSNIDQSESLYFDALEGFSQQLLVEADAALMAAAEAGLFPRAEFFRKFPSHLAASRITLNLFERQPYRVRLAALADIPALLRLEEACWVERMRIGPAELERRIRVYPLGQWLLEMSGAVVGVIYTQRIASLEPLRTCRLRNLQQFHDDRGSVVQLLGLNVLPEVRHLGLGDRLLDLMLLRSSVQGGVQMVAGITRCKEFRGATLNELSDYVRRRDAAGEPLDPILQFHHSHGAALLDVVPDFRPEDTDNLGAGVLLRYDLAHPGQRDGASDDQAPLSATAVGTDPVSRLEACLREALGRKKQSAFSWDRPLREMGLDSLDLLGFRSKLQRSFERPISPTFLFSYPTLKEMRSYFELDASAPAPEAEIPPIDLRLAAPHRPNAAPDWSGRASAIAHPQIAIVGMSGRFPGSPDLDSFWRVLSEGRDAIAEVPADRRELNAGLAAQPNGRERVAWRFGGFLEDIDQFDCGFFNVSPREANAMDPQQRLLLEAHWRAFEHAGIDPSTLRETACGIFVGLHAHDYESLQTASGETSELDIYYATGNSGAVAAGRVAYFLGTRGPALTLDTACSSSLVAVHQAIRSLRTGECSVAIASGINLMLSPRLSVAFARGGMLSPTGRCRTFDAAADGYVRGEGCGAVVLKRLEDALRDGDTVFAILKGSAVNQDGASNGLTAPSLPAQQQLLRSALEDAGVRAADIDYIEAHGTGTHLGDPVEFGALQAVYGGDSLRADPLWLGSVKTNVGHLEAAAGIAGLIKVVLAMRHEWLPAHLHFQRANPHVDLDALPARLPLTGQPWHGRVGPLRAGISSFGFSGTNAHVIVEQAPRVQPGEEASRSRSRHVLALSAKSRPALEAVAADYLHALDANRSMSPALLCRAFNAGRAHHNYRIACVGRSVQELRESLEGARSRIAGVQRAARPPRIAFLFTGQGSQYAGMALELARTEPVFRQALAECRELLRPLSPIALEDILYPRPDAPVVLDDTANTQPALFAVEYALAKMLQSWGIEPTAVMGHSVGEYVAACIAGVFSLADAIALIAARGRLMGGLPQGGAMLALLGPRETVDDLLRLQAAVDVAAYNGPQNTVVSGGRDAVERLAAMAAERGLRVVPLQVSHAFHSRLMEPMLSQFGEIAGRVSFAAPRIQFVSNVLGELTQTEVARADYWVRHIREPVRFEQGIRALLGAQAEVMLEVGPHPVLTVMGQACATGDAAASSTAWLHTLTRGQSDWEGLSAGIAELYERGVDIAWRQIERSPMPDVRTALPGYPWQRGRYWYTETRSGAIDDSGADRTAEAADDWFYKLQWLNSARAEFGDITSSLPASDVILATAAPELRTQATALQVREHDASALSEIERLAGRFAASALQELGLELPIGTRFDARALRTQLRVQQSHARLFDRLLEILAEDGFLENSDGAWRVLSQPPDASPKTSNSRDEGAELMLLRRCGSQLAGVLRGEVNALDLLFSGDGTAGAAEIYGRSPTAIFYNSAIAALVNAASSAIRPDAPLRVLEIGAGTGATSACVLERLRDTPISYAFTDLGRAFVAEARRRYGDDATVRCEVLDIEQPVEPQGFAAGCADIVIAVNVLHATVDLRASLLNARRLLSPGGLLLLLETTTRRRWLDLTFGLTEGWWRFNDTGLRPRQALLDATQWVSLLREVGFDHPRPLAGEISEAQPHAQTLLLARAPASAQVRVPGVGPSLASGPWLLLADHAGLAARLAEQLARAGGTCLIAEPGERLDTSTPGRALFRADVASDLDALLQLQSRWRGVVHCVGLDDHAVGEVLLTAQALVRLPKKQPPTLWVVTRGAQPAWPDMQVEGIGQSLVWGLMRTFAIEHPEIWGGIVDLDPGAPLDALAVRLCRELCSPDGEDQLALGVDSRRVARLQRTRLPASGEILIHDDRLHLITGAFGGLGPQIARWLIERGARFLQLTSRRALPDRSDWDQLTSGHADFARVQIVMELERLGATVWIEGADVADRGQMAALFERIQERGVALGGIVHAAADIDFCAFHNLSLEHLHSAMSAKLEGARLLHELSRGSPLDFFIMFSSAAAIFGASHLGHYAAANEGLNALAHARRAAGLPALSINWGAWEEIRAVHDRSDHFSRIGLLPMRSQRALAAMARLLSAGDAQGIVARINWPVLEAAFAARHRGLLFEQFSAERASKIPAGAGSHKTSRDNSVDWASEINRADARDRQDIVSKLVATEVRAVLGLRSGEPLEYDKGLFESGLDSLMSVQLKDRLARATGADLPSTLTFTYPTVNELSAYLLREAFRNPDAARAESAQEFEAAPEIEGLDDAAVRELLSRELESLGEDLARQ